MPFTVAMVQSSYIPWKGYFDMIRMVDLFVFYDDVQFTKEDWRSRNQIKTKDGPKWLTVPCGSPRGRRICDVELTSSYWQRKHWDVIRHSYAAAPCFEEWRGFFEERYLRRTWRMLSEMNQTLIRDISSDILGIRTDFADSRDYLAPADKEREERWLPILNQIGAERFIVGPSVQSYLGAEGQARVRDAGIELVWMDYSDYPEYEQLHPPFKHQVSIVDLVLTHGTNALRYMKSL